MIYPNPRKLFGIRTLRIDRQQFLKKADVVLRCINSLDCEWEIQYAPTQIALSFLPQAEPEIRHILKSFSIAIYTPVRFNTFKFNGR